MNTEKIIEILNTYENVFKGKVIRTISILKANGNVMIVFEDKNGTQKIFIYDVESGTGVCNTIPKENGDNV